MYTRPFLTKASNFILGYRSSTGEPRSEMKGEGRTHYEGLPSEGTKQGATAIYIDKATETTIRASRQRSNIAPNASGFIIRYSL